VQFLELIFDINGSANAFYRLKYHNKHKRKECQFIATFEINDGQEVDTIKKETCRIICLNRLRDRFQGNVVCVEIQKMLDERIVKTKKKFFKYSKKIGFYALTKHGIGIIRAGHKTKSKKKNKSKK